MLPSIVSAEMNQMMRIAVESEVILKHLCTDEDQYDLREDLDGNQRELFSTDLEIYLADTWELCRTLVATLQEIEAKIVETNTLIRSLSNEENVAAIKTYQNVGFVADGKYRKFIYNNGKYYDSINMTITNNKYTKLNIFSSDLFNTHSGPASVCLNM